MVDEFRIINEPNDRKIKDGKQLHARRDHRELSLVLLFGRSERLRGELTNFGLSAMTYILSFCLAAFGARSNWFPSCWDCWQEKKCSFVALLLLLLLLLVRAKVEFPFRFSFSFHHFIFLLIHLSSSSIKNSTEFLIACKNGQFLTKSFSLSTRNSSDSKTKFFNETASKRKRTIEWEREGEAESKRWSRRFLSPCESSHDPAQSS